MSRTFDIIRENILDVNFQLFAYKKEIPLRKSRRKSILMVQGKPCPI